VTHHVPLHSRSPGGPSLLLFPAEQSSGWVKCLLPDTSFPGERRSSPSTEKEDQSAIKQLISQQLTHCWGLGKTREQAALLAQPQCSWLCPSGTCPTASVELVTPTEGTAPDTLDLRCWLSAPHLNIDVQACPGHAHTPKACMLCAQHQCCASIAVSGAKLAVSFHRICPVLNDQLKFC